MLSETNLPLIINDRVDVALAIGADGVHTQNKVTFPLPAVKKIIPETMIVGISAATLEEATEAERNGADYIGVGALFSTSSKQDATLLPEGMLEEICRQVSIPVIATGGLTAERLKHYQTVAFQEQQSFCDYGSTKPKTRHNRIEVQFEK